MTYPTKQQLYGHLPPIAKTIKIRRTIHAGHCWRSRDELISDVLLLTPSHGRKKAGQPARTYIQQLCIDTECSPEDQPEAMDDWEGWRERVRNIRADGETRWWGMIKSWLVKDIILGLNMKWKVKSPRCDDQTIELEFWSEWVWTLLIVLHSLLD